MNEIAIYEIGNIIRVRNGLFRRLTAKEIIETVEYQRFKKNYPEICKLAEEVNLLEEFREIKFDSDLLLSI